MGLIIDTNVFIHWERSGHGIDFSAWEDRGEVGISVVSASELLVGVHRADTELRRQQRSAFVESILAQLPILDLARPMLPGALGARERIIGWPILMLAPPALWNADERRCV